MSREREAQQMVGLRKIAYTYGRSGWRGSQHLWRVLGRHSAPQQGWWLTPDGVPVWLNEEDWTSAWAFRGLYERPLLKILERTIEPGMVVVDVGANVGVVSSYASSRVGTSGRVVAIEPSTRCVAVLLELGNLVPCQLDVVSTAIGEFESQAVLTGQDLSTHWGLGKIAPATSNVGPTVNVRRLDDVLTELGLGRIDLLKVDVEGLEGDVFAGAGQTLAKIPPQMIAAEVSPIFGSIEWVATVTEILSQTHDLWLLSEVGLLRRTPRLSSTSLGALESEPQSNVIWLDRSKEMSRRLRPWMDRSVDRHCA